jgi:hypothetical protein
VGIGALPVAMVAATTAGTTSGSGVPSGGQQRGLAHSRERQRPPVMMSASPAGRRRLEPDRQLVFGVGDQQDVVALLPGHLQRSCQGQFAGGDVGADRDRDPPVGQADQDDGLGRGEAEQVGHEGNQVGGAGDADRGAVGVVRLVGGAHLGCLRSTSGTPLAYYTYV